MWEMLPPELKGGGVRLFVFSRVASNGTNKNKMELIRDPVKGFLRMSQRMGWDIQFVNA